MQGFISDNRKGVNMQIMIKKIDETEPTIILNDVYMIFENDTEQTITFSINKDDFFDDVIYDKSIVEYFRKVGD